MFGSDPAPRASPPSGSKSWRRLLPARFPRFSPDEEHAFRAEFVAAGRRHKFELWLLLLVITAVLVVFHRYYLTDPGTSRVVLPFLVTGLVIPGLLRWLSSNDQPWLRWSTALFVISAYVDVACLMTIRAITIAAGHDLVPILLPVGVLAAVLVVNVRFSVLLPIVLIGFAGIAVIEMLTIPTDSNQLFNLLASGVILTVPLLSTYELERLSRVAWQRKREFARNSATDALTGLPNRRGFADAVRSDRDASADPSAPIALAVLDLDCFKHLNDTLGHLAGDRALTAVGHYLRDDSAAHGSPGEVIARLSGEEFVAYWPDLDAGAARRRAETLRAGIGELALPLRVTASAGFVCHTPAHDDAAVVLHNLVGCADEALYAAKEVGRDRLMVHTGPVPRDSPSGPAPLADVDRTASPEPAEWAGWLRFTPDLESRFLDDYRRTGLPLRRAVTGSVLAVSALIFVIQDAVLRIPAEASTVGRMFLATSIMPAAAIGLATTFPRRAGARSSYVYVAAIATIVTAQMIQRAIQLPKGYDVVPFLMPLAVLLSLGVVQLPFRLLAPALLTLLTGVVVTEAAVFPITAHAVLILGAAVLMSLVVLRFAYRLEQASRDDWLRSRRLHLLSHRDPLTGLPNRRAFDDDLTRTTAGGLLLLDLDHLKAYNDHYGHVAGDAYLVTIGQAITAAVGSTGTVYRVGGDEFAALLEGDAPDAFAARSEAVVEGVRAAGATTDDGPRTSVSAGLVLMSPGTDGPPDTGALLHNADQLLYSAKEQGRDRVVSGELRSPATAPPSAGDLSANRTR